MTAKKPTEPNQDLNIAPANADGWQLFLTVPGDNQPGDGQAKDQAQLVVTKPGGDGKPVGAPGEPVVFKIISGQAKFLNKRDTIGDADGEDVHTDPTGMVKQSFTDAAGTDSGTIMAYRKSKPEDVSNVATYHFSEPDHIYAVSLTIEGVAYGDGNARLNAVAVVTDKGKPLSQDMWVDFTMAPIAKASFVTVYPKDPNTAIHGPLSASVKTRLVGGKSTAAIPFSDPWPETFLVTAKLRNYSASDQQYATFDPYFNITKYAGWVDSDVVLNAGHIFPNVQWLPAGDKPTDQYWVDLTVPSNSRAAFGAVSPAVVHNPQYISVQTDTYSELTFSHFGTANIGDDTDETVTVGMTIQNDRRLQAYKDVTFTHLSDGSVRIDVKDAGD